MKINFKRIYNLIKKLFKKDTPAPVPTPEPPVVVSYTVSRGDRVEKKITGPGSLSFTLTPKSIINFEDSSKAQICWAYSEEFTGGVGGSKAEAGCRTYKMKVYDKDGVYIKEPRYTPPWQEGVPVAVEFVWDDDGYALKVGPQVVTVDCSMPDEQIVGYGWPPAVRPGVEGSVITDVKWKGIGSE